MGQSLTIQTWPSRSMMLALISPTFSLMSTLKSWSPFMIFSRASFTQDGQSESVCRGQPSGGFVFFQDFKSGLSDHFGGKEGFGLYFFKKFIVSYAKPAATLMAWSKYFINPRPFIFCIVLFSSSFC